ncbi:MAG: ABC transporter ATP-binding protein [Candidatus Moranbacteria bacterium]|nr:ABC transporter ATP-binding protein [Candidatus Moranbacteria bacterium]MDD3965018.1 ABC transporter ATP-binding protein [Candidatus Moranbacteria bacterium]
MQKPIIQFKDVTKIYSGAGVSSTMALNGINLEIYENEFVAITGSSGSGKSTILNLIGLLDDPTSGEILFNGKNVHQLNEKEKNTFRLQSIGFIFQFFNLIDNYTALENIVFQLELQGKSYEKAKADGLEILKYLHLENRAHLYPKNLSGGEQQRVAIGRALAKESPFIIADEPTAHLDSKNSQDVMDILHHIQTTFHRTLILVTHEPFQAEQADRQIIIRDGKVAEIITKKIA